MRLTNKFASNTSLWEILRQFESKEGANYNFTQRGVPQIDGGGATGAGRLNYEMPVITVMPGHREESSFVGLQKTLGQLGFDSGSALLRLSFKNSDRPLEEAMAEISQYFRGAENPASGAHAAISAQESSMPDLDKAAPEASENVAGETIKSEEPEPEPMDVDSAPQVPQNPTPAPEPAAVIATEQEQPKSVPPISAPSVSDASAPAPEIAGIGRNVQIYAAPTSSTPQAARRAFNENDYVPTVEHAKIHQAALQSRTRNQRLPSDKELADIENARQEKLKEIAERGSSVRIRLPDQMMLQTSVSKEDTAESLYAFVEQYLQYKEPFQLKYLSPKNGRQVPITRDKKFLIKDLGFTSAELITFLWDEKASDEARLSRKALAPEWQGKAQELRVEEPVVDEKPEPVASGSQSKAEGKKKVISAEDKESKLKNILGKGLFKKR